MKYVRDLLQKKEGQIWTIARDATVFSALEIMAEKDVGALVVIEEADIPCGIFSERDYARKVILKGKSSKKTLISDLMTCDVIYVHPNQTVEDCMVVMTQKHIRHLPVMDNKKLIGVISIGDVVKAALAEKEFIIEQMVTYIHGDR